MAKRTSATAEPYDLLIIGGGINGCGIARDAAGRGLKVMLCEKGDLASATSSASSKLIHGGLRYLESYEFRLVREALGEREVLLKLAPHIIWPMRFILPVAKGMRPAWMLRAGLFIYDHLARRNILPGTRTLNLQTSPQGVPLKPHLKLGFEYSDCWADDARLVVINAMDAADRGAVVETRTACVGLSRGDNVWTATLEESGGRQKKVAARAIVNAAGPWVDEILAQSGRKPNRANIRLVKGSHIVLPRLYEGDHCYIFQSPDGRVIFVIPYGAGFTLVGTTEEDWLMEQGAPTISAAETDYLCQAINDHFKRQVTPDDILWTYSGVRPLFDDQNENASVVTRDYVFDLDDGGGEGPLALSIFGGKLTTYRELAERAVDQLAPRLGGSKGAWTEDAPLPGGDMPLADYDAFVAGQAARFPWVPIAMLSRLARSYGTCMDAILALNDNLVGLGAHFGADLYEAEVRYLIDHEFARTAEDIIWRRSKLGLVLGKAEVKVLEAFCAKRLTV